MYFFCLDILNQFEQTDKTVRKYFPIIEIAFKLRIFSLFKISRMLLENMERSMSEDNIYLYRTWALAGNSVFNLKNLDSKVRETKDFEIYLNPENLSTYEISKKIKQTLKVISTFSEETGSNFDISKSKLERFFKKKTSLSPNEQDLIFYAFIFNEWQDEQDTLFTI